MATKSPLNNPKPLRTPARRRWRDYRTPAGGRPILEFIERLTENEAAEVAAAMADVRKNGRAAARHLRGDIYEVRVDAHTQLFRVLFATVGRDSHILLALTAFAKKTRKAPIAEIELAQQRLELWLTRRPAKVRRPAPAPSRP